MASNTPINEGPEEVPVATIEHQHSTVEQFLEDHKNAVIIGFVAIMLGTIGWATVTYINQKKHSEASQAFTSATTVEDLSRVADEQKGSVSGGSARLVLAQKLWADGKKEESNDALTKFMEQFPDHPRFFSAVVAKGLQAHANGDFATARSSFGEVIGSDKAPADLSQQAQLFLGDLEVAEGMKLMKEGNEEGAKGLFDKGKIAYENLKAAITEDNVFMNSVSERMERIKHLGIPYAEAPPEPPAPEEPAPSAGGGETVTPPVDGQ
ncbi:MAG: tetratricopeptide repeat protein, partial [Verrucomicrobiota bacterium]